MNFTVSVDHSVKIKENETRDKHLNLAKDLNMLWNMKMMLIPIVIGTLETIPKGLVKGIEKLDIGKRADAIQTTAFLRSARILRRVLET